jgi:hypothetical protein
MAMRPSVVLWLVAVGLLLRPVPGSAQEAPAAGTADQHISAGQAASERGDHPTAAREFISAYGINKDPVLLKRIAGAYEALGKASVAVVFYRRYLKEDITLTEEQREEVRAKVKELEPPPPPPPPPRPSPPPEVPVETAGTAPPPTEVTPADTRSQGPTQFAPGSPDTSEDEPPEGPRVVVEVHLARAMAVDTQGGLFVGYRNDSLIFGLGLEFAREATETTSDAGKEAVKLTTLVIEPGVRIPLSHSLDGRVEVFAKLDLGLGQTILHTERDGKSNDQSSTKIVVLAGAGLRYWLHPQLALGGSSGLRVDHALASDTAGSSASAEVASLFTAVELLGLF